MNLGTANSFKFAGTELSGTSYNVMVINDDMPYMPGLRLRTEPLTGADGNVTQGANYEAINVTLECAMFAESPAALDTQIGSLVTVLEKSADGDQDFVLGRRPSGTYQARCVSPLELKQRGITGATFDLEFHIPNPNV